MSAGEKVAAASNRFYQRIRHPQALQAAATEGSAGLESLTGHKYALLTTFRRSGVPVPTPVWFGIADGRLYVHTEEKVAKVKRIRHDPHVRVAPCTVRGKPLGPNVEGRARVLGPDEAARAEAALRANYGLGRRVYNAVNSPFDVDTVYLEVTPA